MEGEYLGDPALATWPEMGILTAEKLPSWKQESQVIDTIAEEHTEEGGRNTGHAQELWDWPRKKKAG